MQLDNGLLNNLPDNCDAPTYDRRALTVGIVHLGAGAFHRAHQAYFTERVLEHDIAWGICAVSMNSTHVKDALSPQDGLYTLAIQGNETRYRVIGAIKELMCLKLDRAPLLHYLKSPKIRVISLTITEKGYCLNAKDDLDFTNKAIVHDLNHPDEPCTAIGLIAQTLVYRDKHGIEQPSVVSCDNLMSNGVKLKRAVCQFIGEVYGQDHLNAIHSSVKFPCTMVDSITPATDDQLRATVKNDLGFSDAWPIKREPFAQWVIEAIPGAVLPPWDKVGVIYTNDIDGFEKAKLRLLNLPHSALAYIGLLLGFKTVYDAINHPVLAQFISDLINQEIIPSFTAPEEMNVEQYRDDVINRFTNPSIMHLLSQIACDGSLKLMVRLIPTIKDNLKNGRSVTKLCQVLAAWMVFVEQQSSNNNVLVDPNKDLLNSLVGSFTQNPEDNLNIMLRLDSVFDTALISNPIFMQSMQAAYFSVNSQGIEALINRS